MTKRHRYPDNPPRRRPTQLRHRIFHCDNPTWDADSYRGIDDAHRHGYRWIDLNFCVTRSRHLVNFHWPRPLAHGYHDPAGLLLRAQHVGGMSLAEALRLLSGAGDPVHTAEAMLAHAGRVGLHGVELELKPGCRPVNYARACAVVDAAEAAGVQLVVKSLVEPGGPHAAVRRLRPFHRAGATTLLLTHGHAAPRSSWGVVDHVRGRVTWTGPAARPHKEDRA